MNRASIETIVRAVINKLDANLTDQEIKNIIKQVVDETFKNEFYASATYKDLREELEENGEIIK
jgi:uncharacterized protein YpuA (DUF1002 family)